MGSVCTLYSVVKVPQECKETNKGLLKYEVNSNLVSAKHLVMYLEECISIILEDSEEVLDPEVGTLVSHYMN
jgi:hypothetical protein